MKPVECLKNSENHQDLDRKNKNLMQLSIVHKYISDMSEETKMKFWIKTLLSSYKIFPEIIRTIDKIIELQATSLSFYTDVFNMSKCSIKEYEKVIDLSERKNNVINIYLMTKSLMDGLDEEDNEILEKRFIDGWNSEDIAADLGVSRRTVFRRLNKIFHDITQKCKSQKWTLRLIESQTKTESWLKDKYLKLVTETYKNSHFKSKEYVQTYNKSSSELYVGNFG